MNKINQNGAGIRTLETSIVEKLAEADDNKFRGLN